MKAKHTKTHIITFMLVAIVSLAIGLVHIHRERETRTEIRILKLVQKQLAFKRQPSENHKNSRILSNLNKQAANNATTLKLQPYVPPDSTSESATETFADPFEFPDNEDEFLREEIQDMLAEAIEAEFPELIMDETQLEALTSNVITIRESLQATRGMERTGENVDALMQLQEMRDQAMLNFERITGMRTLIFMLQAPADGGIDHD